MTARYHAPDAPKPGIAILLSLLALALMFADARLGVLAPVRQVLGGALYPVQAALAWPMQQVESFEGYFDDMEALRNDNRLLRTVLIQQAGVLAARMSRCVTWPGCGCRSRRLLSWPRP